VNKKKKKKKLLLISVSVFLGSICDINVLPNISQKNSKKKKN
jgi:hypothetical protein